MGPNEHDELSAAERAALAALPRERTPSRLLEERTVRVLRERGFLRPAARKRRLLPPSWLAAGIAAALALFTSGVAVGQWLGTRGAADALAQIRETDSTAESALHVQRAGSAYVAALTQLVAAADSASANEASQAREVALAALWAAANEIIRLAPDDPVTGQILRGFERARQEQAAGQDEELPVRQVIWF